MVVDSAVLYEKGHADVWRITVKKKEEANLSVRAVTDQDTEACGEKPSSGMGALPPDFQDSYLKPLFVSEQICRRLRNDAWKETLDFLAVLESMLVCHIPITCDSYSNLVFGNH
ncbi:hypothetical protein NDU88_002366 [Pleurodeles waltl]|uniref:Uncharacterized protein n=1 Tax=Pleurodeles waltl TaxID=8319 RepID=A0AAV7VCD7_PLEWA|nr:hypothetical protein NDU88_002366 [Pleurodeles waltl]